MMVELDLTTVQDCVAQGLCTGGLRGSPAASRSRQRLAEGSTTPKPSRWSTRCARLTRTASTRSSISSTARAQLRRDAEILKSGGSLVSTLKQQTKGGSLSTKARRTTLRRIANPLSSAQGLNEDARMLADGTITTRIRSTVELDGAGHLLEKLRNGGLRGSAPYLSEAWRGFRSRY